MDRFVKSISLYVQILLSLFLGVITGSLRTVLLIVQWYTRKSLSEDIFESKVKEGLVVQGLSL